MSQMKVNRVGFPLLVAVVAAALFGDRGSVRAAYGTIGQQGPEYGWSAHLFWFLGQWFRIRLRAFCVRFPVWDGRKLQRRTQGGGAPKMSRIFSRVCCVRCFQWPAVCRPGGKHVTQ